MKECISVLGELSSRGVRMTRTREAILSLFSEAGAPLSVPRILESLEETGRRPNKTTVYRELEFLKGLGIVKELTLRNDLALYELSGPHHHHLVCVDCGTVRDIAVSDESLLREERRIERKEGFRVLEHSLEFFGICGNCR
ncbi:MAG: transcriptional repressor [Candidatus Moranbacteria bacterium]|nr:transcriptional repressor [Candidatus Moranbacteria bacterium]